MKKILFVLTFVIVSVFAFGGSVLAREFTTPFPSSIKSSINYDYVGSNGYCNLGSAQGRTLCAKLFSSGSISQSAICTSFNKKAPEGITCNPVAWSNNSYNET